MWQWPGQTDDKGYSYNSHACFQIPQLEFTFNIYISDCDEKAAILSRCLASYSVTTLLISKVCAFR